VPAKWHLNPPNKTDDIGDRETDRQTNRHATEKRVGIGGSACASRSNSA